MRPGTTVLTVAKSAAPRHLHHRSRLAKRSSSHEANAKGRPPSQEAILKLSSSAAVSFRSCVPAYAWFFLAPSLRAVAVSMRRRLLPLRAMLLAANPGCFQSSENAATCFTNGGRMGSAPGSAEKTVVVQFAVPLPKKQLK